jgi:hypothetical protein
VATLVLPTAAVAVEYATSFGPFGTGSVAYTQQHLPLLRPTSNGLPLATGPLGRTCARANHFTTQAHVQVAHLPADETPTPLRNPQRCRCLGLHAGAAPAGRGRVHPFVEGRRQDVRARRLTLIGAVLERSRSPGARGEDRREHSGPLVLSPLD